ncbi:MAG: hypothetical protein AABX70_02555 [Nanoarchaeota archaeon]
MKHYYPNPHPRRSALSHPIRSLVQIALVAYMGWAFRGCTEKPQTLAYRLNQRVSEAPARNENLVNQEMDELYLLKSKAHRHHPVLEGYVHPREVRLIWAEERGKDYAIVQLKNGHEYVIREEGLQERFDRLSSLEKEVKATKGDGK